MTARNLILFAALFASSAAAGYLFYGARQTQSSSGTTAANAPVLADMRPVFSLPDADGLERSITEWDGKALVVNFWATWCPPCLREIPMLIDANDELAANDIQIIGIAVDEADAVREFAAGNSFNYPILVGEQEAVDAAEAFGAEVVGLPLTIFTDYSGRIIEIHSGELSREQLDDTIALLK